MEHSTELNEMSAALERLSEYPVTSEYVNAVSKTLEFLSKQELTAIDDAALDRFSDAALEAIEYADRVRERRGGPVAPDTPPPVPLIDLANRRTRPPCWYTVKPGNTLEWISHHFYGHKRYWGEIWRANPGISNPNLLEPGWELWIPSLGGVHEQVNQICPMYSAN